jgi:peptidoglycan/LPS O-acetylase OafA/YrhL
VDPWRDRLAMFIAGILLYETMTSTAIPRKLTKGMEWAALAFFALSFVGIALLYERHDSLAFLPGYERVSGTYRVALMFASFYLFALFCFAFDGITNRIFCFTPMRWLGNISYSYYLIHGLTLLALGEVCHRLIRPSGHSPALVVAFGLLGFAATVATSTALFLLVEKPYSLAPKARPAVKPAEPARGTA